MPTLFARRYVRKIEDVGGIEKVIGVFILLLVAAILTAFVVQVATNKDYLFTVDQKAYAPPTPDASGGELKTAPGSTRETAGAFPDPGLEGWSTPQQIDRFDADNLWIEIDGRAAAYLRHGVVELTVGTYHHQSNGDRTVDVYWYDMGKPANALAMYRSEEPPDAPPVPIGRAGYQVGGAVFFCEGSSYVQVMPSRPGDADAQVALNIAERLAERIAEE